MIPIFLLLISTITAQIPTHQTNIRSGIAKIQIGNVSQASYTILFKSSLTSLYSSTVAASYSTSFDTTNGIVINSICQNTTLTSMQCTLTSFSNNQYNIVYVSYIASGVDYLILGMDQQTFSFSNATSISQRVTLERPLDRNDINQNNALFMHFYPFIAGISTEDSNASLKMQQPTFNPLTVQLSVFVTMEATIGKSITVYFGYILYDVSVLVVTFYEGQKFSSDSIAEGYIYAISQFKVNSSISKRVLQTDSPEMQYKKEQHSSFPTSAQMSTIKVNEHHSTFKPQRTLQEVEVVSQPIQKERLLGIDNGVFNSIFATNLFVIINTADDIDQLYYFQVVPVQTKPISTPIATNDEAITQNAGTIQQEGDNMTIICSAGTTFDALRKICL